MIIKMIPALIALLLVLPVSILSAGQSMSTAVSESQKINLAVLTLKNASGITEGEASLIADRLRGELFNTGRANVMEREQMSEVLKEQGFQQSGACTDEACLVQMGQMLGVQAIVSGSIGKLGSMYLINFRVIDVKTGKITAVVSRDLKGDIEDVVEFLKDIAVELVKGAAGTAPKGSGSAVQIQVAPKQEEKRIENPVEEVQKEQPVKEEKEEAKEEKEPETVDGNKEDMNKNRGGIRLAFSMFPGTPSMVFNGSKYELDTNNSTFSSSHFLKADILFLIKAGPWLAINVGPSFAWLTQQYKYTTNAGWDGTIDVTYGQLGVQPGVNFVKRWHPLKLNIGVFADLGMSWINSNLTAVDPYFGNEIDTLSSSIKNNFGIGVTAGWGGRAGIEFLIQNRIGFNVDFVFRYCSWNPYEVVSESDKFHAKLMYGYNDMYDTDPSVEMILPMIGLDFGVNFYF